VHSLTSTTPLTFPIPTNHQCISKIVGICSMCMLPLCRSRLTRCILISLLLKRDFSATHCRRRQWFRSNLRVDLRLHLSHHGVGLWLFELGSLTSFRCICSCFAAVFDCIGETLYAIWSCISAVIEGIIECQSMCWALLLLTEPPFQVSHVYLWDSVTV
jgi:hypothetical protein